MKEDMLGVGNYALRFAMQHCASASMWKVFGDLGSALSFLSCRFQISDGAQLVLDYELADGTPAEAAVAPFARLVAKEMPILSTQPDAIFQLAVQQPDDSAPYKAWLEGKPYTRRLITWRNKPSQVDPCILSMKFQGRVNGFAQLPGRRYAVAAGEKVEVRDARSGVLIDEFEVRDARSGDLIDEFECEARCIAARCGFFAVGCTPDKRRTEGRIKVWDAASLTLKSEKVWAHHSVINSVAFNHNGTLIVSGCQDRSIRVWDTATLELKAEKWDVGRTYISSVQFSPDGTQIVSADELATIQVWDLRPLDWSGWEEVDISAMPRKYGCVKVDGLGDVDSNYWQNTITGIKQEEKPLDATLDLKAEKPERDKDHLYNLVRSVQFSPDGAQIVFDQTVDDSIEVWAIPSALSKPAKLELKSKKMNAHSDGICSVAFSPDGKTIVSGGLRDQTIKLWNADSLSLITEKQNAHSYGNGRSITSVQFSLDGSKIVSGSIADNTIKVWNADSLTKFKEKKQNAHAPSGTGPFSYGWRDSIAAAKFSPDGSKIVSGGMADRTIKVWDAESMTLKCEKADAHGQSITFIDFSPDGKTIVSSSQLEMITKIWDSGTLDLIEENHGIHFMKFFFDLERTSAGGVAEVDGSTLRIKEGGAFYAPSPLLCVDVHWPKIVVGAESGELYRLEVQ
mmetsp:Transcript_32066/g.79247  ORF Transcript_32066/g.79247 Transcript_32066/m.79247 type:complete len:681 (+) Transcript_32066:2323-4365(+)